MKFKPIHLKHSHTINLNGRVESLFKLFTPEGERLWVAGWDPQFYFPDNEKTCEGTVFTTESEKRKTVWTCVRFDTENYSVQYVRTTIGSDTAIVSVKCNQIGNNKTEAEVSYDFTSLSVEGNKHLEKYTAEYFIDYINSWETEIHKYLNNKTI